MDLFYNKVNFNCEKKLFIWHIDSRQYKKSAEFWFGKTFNELNYGRAFFWNRLLKQIGRSMTFAEQNILESAIIWHRFWLSNKNDDFQKKIMFFYWKLEFYNVWQSLFYQIFFKTPKLKLLIIQTKYVFSLKIQTKENKSKTF